MEGQASRGPEDGEGPGVGATAWTAPRRARMPLAAARLWRPREAPGGSTRVQDLPFFGADPLREMVEQVGSGPGTEVGGILLGERRTCPVTGRRWVLVRETLPVAVGEEPVAGTGWFERLEAVLSELRRGGTADSVAVGWYRSHALLGLFLSEPEARFHDRRLPGGWPLAVVFEAEATPGGAVFRREREGESRRTVRIPFYELLERGARGEAGRGLGTEDAATRAESPRVVWRNYVAEAPEEPTPRAPSRNPRTARRDPPGVAVENGPSDAGASAGGTRERGQVIEDGAGRSLDGGTAPGSRGDTGGSDSTADGEIPLLLPPESPGRFRQVWWRWRTAVLALLTVVLLGAAAWIVADVLGDGRENVPTETTNAAAERFDELDAQLATAIGAYRAAMEGFEAGEAGCTALQEAYLEMDRAFLALADHVGGVRGSLGRRELARYEAVASEVADLDRGYAASDCPRPD